MLLGKVAGTVWGSIRGKNLDGYKLLEVVPLKLLKEPGMDPDEEEGKTLHLALDALQAGPGDIVLVGHGTRIREITVGMDIPVKSVVIAIVDSFALYDEGGVGGGA